MDYRRKSSAPGKKANGVYTEKNGKKVPFLEEKSLEILKIKGKLELFWKKSLPRPRFLRFAGSGEMFFSK